MPSITDTDLAPVTTTGTDLYLYYQDSQGSIIETHSSDGKTWQKSSQAVASDALTTSGSPIAAYYVQKDANFSNKSTIHVFYLNKDKKLIERVRDLSGSSWANGKIPDDIAKSVREESHLAGGAYNSTASWNPNGSQWVYFHQFTDSKEQLLEIRRTPSDPVYPQAVLPENAGESLSNSALAVSIFQGGINLFFQDHDENVALYANRNNTWQKKKVVIPASSVQPITPIAAAESADGSGKQHLIVVDQSKKIQHYADEKLVDFVENFYPGTRLGAVLQGSKIVLFYKSLNPVGSVRTKVYDGGAWKDGGEVVSAQ